MREQGQRIASGRGSRVFSWILLLLVVAGSVCGGDPDLWQRYPLVTAPDVTGTAPPTLDGQVARAEWYQAAQLGPLRVGHAGVTDSIVRDVFLSYDATALYLGFRLRRSDQAPDPAVPAEPLDQALFWATGDGAEITLDPDHAGGGATRALYVFRLFGGDVMADARVAVHRDDEEQWHTVATDLEWNAGAVYRSAPLPAPYDGWQGEIAIPWVALGGRPPAGAIWGFDFVDRRETPAPAHAHFSYRGPNWSKAENLGHLRFGRAAAGQPAPAVRFLRAGDAGRLTPYVLFDFINARPGAGAVQATLNVYKRKLGAEGGLVEYYPFLDNIAGMGEGYVGDTMENQIRAMLGTDGAGGFYHPGGADLEQALVTIPAGTSRRAGALGPGGPAGSTWDDPLGDYLVLYEMTDPVTAERLAAGVLPFRLNPLRITVEAYWLYARRLAVQAFFDEMPLKEETPYRVLFEALDADGTVLSAASRTIQTTDQMAAGELVVDGDPTTPDDDWPVDASYEVRVSLQERPADGADYQTVISSSQYLYRPPFPPWYRNSYGLNQAVPPPWTPLESDAAARTVSVWGRTYVLDGLFPSRILSQGREVLAGAVSLEIATPAAGPLELDWNLTEWRQVHSAAGRVEFRAALTSSVATVSGTVWIEFDGLLWYDLILAPVADTLEVLDLVLDLPLNPELAELKTSAAPIEIPGLSVAPEPQPASWESGAFGDMRRSFAAYLWAGNEQAGLGWICEAPERWHAAADPAGLLETIAPRNAEEPARMRIHIIRAHPDQPVTLRRADPLPLRFGLQATPIRALPDPRVTRVWQGGTLATDAALAERQDRERTQVTVGHSSWRATDSNVHFAGWPTRCLDADREARVRAGVEWAAQDFNGDGVTRRTVLYTGWGIDLTADEYRYHAAEFCLKPYENSGANTMRQSPGRQGAYGDYLAWAWADLIEHYDVDGVFWDSTARCWQDENELIGNGWRDAAGILRPAAPVLASRELFRRIYSLFHGETFTINGRTLRKPEGVIINHPASVWPVNAFADVHHRGEGQAMTGATLWEAWRSLEHFRVNYAGTPFGQPLLGMSKDFKGLPLRVINHAAIHLLHAPNATAKTAAEFSDSYYPKKQGYAYGHRPTLKIWAANEWLDYGPRTVQYPYYRQPPVAVVTPGALSPGGGSWTPGPQDLQASVFVNPERQRALIVVANLGVLPGAAYDPANESVVDSVKGTVRVALDLEALGLAQPGSVYLLEDAIDKDEEGSGRETIPLTASGAFDLVLRSERFRLLRLSLAPDDVPIPTQDLILWTRLDNQRVATHDGSPAEYTGDGQLLVTSSGYLHYWQDLSVELPGNASADASLRVSNSYNYPEWVQDDVNGYSAPRFDGSHRFLGLSGDGNADINQAGPYAGKTLCFTFRTGADVTTRQVLWEQGRTADAGLNLYLSAGRLYLGAWNAPDAGGWERFLSFPVLEPRTVYTVTLVFDAGQDSFRGYLNGTLFGAAGAITPLSSHGATGITRVRQYTRYHDGPSVDNGDVFAGTLCEAVLYNTVLTTGERRALEAYLMARYGVELDRDGDGLPDAWERLHFGNLTATDGLSHQDWDDNGYPDREEYLAGTDPTRPEAALRLHELEAPAGERRLTLRWASEMEKCYRIETTETLAGPWAPVADQIPATPPVNSREVPVETVPAFFRIGTWSP